MNDIQINIMGVVDRLAISASLQNQTGGRLFTDKNKTGSWWNAKRAWSFNGGKSHILVLQDDVQLCEFMFPLTIGRSKVTPKHIITYFTGPWFGRIRRWAKMRNEHWVRFQAVVTAQAILMPSDLVADFLSWDGEHMQQKPMHDDPHIRAWQLENNIDTWCTVPELVEHIGAAKSIVWPGDPTYRHRSIDFQQNLPRDFDWTLGADCNYIHPVQFHNKLWVKYNKRDDS